MYKQNKDVLQEKIKLINTFRIHQRNKEFSLTSLMKGGSSLHWPSVPKLLMASVRHVTPSLSGMFRSAPFWTNRSRICSFHVCIAKETAVWPCIPCSCAFTLISSFKYPENKQYGK